MRKFAPTKTFKTTSKSLQMPTKTIRRLQIPKTRSLWFLNGMAKKSEKLNARSAFFPRASERRVLPIVVVCQTSSHLHIFSSSDLLILHPHIFTSSYLHILTSSHPHIFTSAYLHILTSSHLRIFTSSHPHIFSSSHLLILTSSHPFPHIFTSSHLHICSSSHLLILTSSHPHIFTPSHLHIFSLALLLSCPLALSFFSISLLKILKARGSANETARNATLSHEMKFHRQKLR